MIKLIKPPFKSTTIYSDGRKVDMFHCQICGACDLNYDGKHEVAMEKWIGDELLWVHNHCAIKWWDDFRKRHISELT